LNEREKLKKRTMGGPIILLGCGVGKRVGVGTATVEKDPGGEKMSKGVVRTVQSVSQVILRVLDFKLRLYNHRNVPKKGVIVIGKHSEGEVLESTSTPHSKKLLAN